MLTRLIVVGSVLGALTACPNPSGNPYTYDGYVMEQFFNVEVGQGWLFMSDDATVPYMIHGEVLDNGYDGTSPDRVHTIEYTKRCFQEDAADCTEGEFLFSWDMAGNGSRGVHLYSAKVGDTELAFDPPMMMAGDQMKVTDQVTTETLGSTWTSEFVQTDGCSIRWADWEECAVMSLDDGGANSGLAATYWVAAGWNIVAIQYPGEAGRWSLEEGTLPN